MSKINCSILTPEKSIYDGEVDLAVIEAFDGQRGFLVNHCALISELGIGELKLRNGSVTDYMVVEGGLVEIKNNKMIVLAEFAYLKNELKKEELQQKLKSLEEEVDKAGRSDRLLLKIEEKKLKARLRVALK